MSRLKCGCLMATSNNTASVRHGYEMGGYVKEFCKKHRKGNPVDELEEATRELVTACENLEYEAGRVDSAKSRVEDILDKLEND